MCNPMVGEAKNNKDKDNGHKSCCSRANLTIEPSPIPIENKTKDKKITINILYDSIEIIDNAGGIPLNVIKDIFKVNVTTKEEGKGTGIGLYICSQIAQKYNGNLSVENTDDGAKFIFKKNKGIIKNIAEIVDGE